MKVVVAIITNEQGNVLLTQRASHLDHGGQWEFPGGKLEPGETSIDALIREVKEEVDLQVVKADFLCEVNHTYPNKSVTLLTYVVTEFTGTAHCCETQTQLQWADIQSLRNYDFPEGNKPIIQTLMASFSQTCSS